MKRKIFSVISVLLIFATLTVVAFSSNSSLPSQYETPIPLGAEVDLVDGLSEAQIKSAKSNYYKNSSTDWRQQIENIHYNFRKSIDEEQYYGGCYWEGDTKELQHFYILVTDMSVVPNEIIKIGNDRLHFLEVKYSEAELQNFMDMVVDNFLYEGLSCIYPDVKKNKIHIGFFDSFDIKRLSELLPEDSYEYAFGEGGATGLATVTVNNGAGLSYVGSDGGTHYGSVGFPVTWGTNNANKGWLTAGHVVKTNGITVKYGSYTLGTSSNTKVTGHYDAATILRNSSEHTFISSPYGPYDDIINYQEGTDASLPSVGDTIEFRGAATNANRQTKIYATNYSNWVDGNWVSSMVVGDSTDIKSGDSGGPVIRENADYTYTAVGVITAIREEDNRMCYSRIKEIRNGISNLSVAAFTN